MTTVQHRTRPKKYVRRAWTRLGGIACRWCYCLGVTYFTHPEFSFLPESHATFAERKYARTGIAELERWLSIR